MPKRNLVLGFWAGLIVGVIFTIALSVGLALPRAAAQAQPKEPTATVQRYQVSAWAYPALPTGPGGGGSSAMHGAYVLDTQSGKLWRIREDAKPEPVGMVQ
jgi:hypothetical protein